MQRSPRCPHCHEPVKVGSLYCEHCGTELGAGSDARDDRKEPPGGVIPWTAYGLITISVVLLVVGMGAFLFPVAQVPILAASAVFAVLGRVAQAGTYQDEIMDELRRRR